MPAQAKKRTFIRKKENKKVPVKAVKKKTASSAVKEEKPVVTSAPTPVVPAPEEKQETPMVVPATTENNEASPVVTPPADAVSAETPPPPALPTETAPVTSEVHTDAAAPVPAESTPPQAEGEAKPRIITNAQTVASESSDTPATPSTPAQQAPAPFQPAEIAVEEPEQSSKKMLFIGGGVVILLGVAAGVFLYTSFFQKPAPQPKPAEEKPVAQKPVASPTPAFNREDWTIEVLNGSGVSGAGAKTAALLEDLGYTVTRTGNAQRSNYETTELYVTESMWEQRELLLADLEDAIEIATISGELDTATPSARIIVGKE